MSSKHFHAFNGPENFKHRWFMLHQQAAFATTDIRKQAFIENIYNLCENFGCKTCQSHFKQYLDIHSFEPYMTMVDVYDRDIGMFEYTRLFHNAVNIRLGKPTYNFDEVYSFYAGSNKTSCPHCDGKDTQDHKNAKKDKQRKAFKSYKEFRNLAALSFPNHVE